VPSTPSGPIRDPDPPRSVITASKGSLGTATWKGEALEQWQFEVTGGGRIWYVIDDTKRTAWIIYAGTGHPKATD
jgi:hypothetical protein